MEQGLNMTTLSSFMQDKSAIRKEILALRKALSPDTLQATAKAASAHILDLPQWQTANQVLLYMPIANEIDTKILLENAWATGKEVLLPRCDTKQKGIMHVALCQSMDDLCVGAYGILEPTERCSALEPSQLRCQLAMIPAVAFDAHGNRLGYGGGYYDRFLAHESMASTCLVGFAHHVQIVPELPAEPWDRTMHAVCSELGLTWHHHI